MPPCRTKREQETGVHRRKLRGRGRRGGPRITVPRTRSSPRVKITAIRLDRMRLPLDPPFHAAWDPVPRRHFDATLVRVETDEGVTGYGSGDTMDGFEPFEPLLTGRDPLPIADHVRTIESIGFHACRYWPLEAALSDIIGQVTGSPSASCSAAPPAACPPTPRSARPAARRPGPRPRWQQWPAFRAMKIRIPERTWFLTSRPSGHPVGRRRRLRPHGRPEPVVADARRPSPALDLA